MPTRKPRTPPSHSPVKRCTPLASPHTRLLPFFIHTSNPGANPRVNHGPNVFWVGLATVDTMEPVEDKGHEHLHMYKHEGYGRQFMPFFFPVLFCFVL